MGRSAIVAGTGFEDRAQVVRAHCREGKVAFLIRDSRNQYDENAIGVYFEVPSFFGLFGEKKVQIGYIKSGTAKSIAKRMDAGESVTARVKSFYAPEGRDFPRVTLEMNI